MALLNGTTAENHVSRQQAIDDQAADFWRGQLVGLDIGRFPHTSPSTHRAPEWPMKTQEYVIDDASLTSQTDTTSIFRTAWSVLLSRHSASADTVFGICHGGTTFPVPVRIQVDEDATVAELLHRVKSDAAKLLPYNGTSLSEIQGLSDEAQRACLFQTLLIEGGAEEEQLSRILTTNNYLPNTCSLVLGWSGQDTDRVRLSWHADPSVLTSEEVQRLAHQLQLLLHQLTQPDLAHTKLRHLQQASNHDLSTIWKWNAHVPSAVQDNVHRLFAEQVWANPSAPAVRAWDGDLSYSELDKASAALAGHIAALGVRPGTIVPLCLTKSVYVPVAILAVMKAGGASVLLDVTLPAARLRNIVEQLPSNELILCSAGHESLAADACPKGTAVTVSQSSLDHLRRRLAEGPITPTSPALPDSPLYVVFTSGSTGKPKGAIVTHANFCAAVRHHQGADALGFSPASRVLDLVSYAFDVAWSNILHTLTAGGCLCIPSEAQRATGAGIARAFAALGANVLHVTPTVARVLDPGRLSGLEKIMFIGEPLSRADAARWERDGMQVLNTYGPAECTVTSTFSVVESCSSASSSSSSMATARDPSIGRAIGAVAWVVHPDGQRLAALGTVGELWLEGPIVGAGYMDEPEKTAAAFVESPPWLTAGLPEQGVEGRRGRLYRTGDMVRYNADGTISFAGRRDNQVKIRGQRIELGEVEHHAREMLPADRVPQVVAEVIKLNSEGLADRADTHCLVLFFTLAAEDSATDMLPLEHRAAPLVAALQKHLPVLLPSAMVPSAFVPLAALPMTASGKTDRKKLRELGASLGPDLLLGRGGGSGAGSEEAGEREPLTTDTERKLASLWKVVLRLKPDAVVGAGDSFLRHGGDSVLAMQLADAAHDAGLALSVQDILRHPCLRDMARVAESGGPNDGQDETPVLRFSLLQPGTDDDDVRSRAAALCGVPDPDMVEDVFPCTPLQEGLLAMTALTPDQYVARNLVELHPDVDPSRFEQALRRVIASMPILRTRIVDLPGQGLTQVVLRHATQEPRIIARPDSGSTDDLWCTEHNSLGQPMGLGTDLARFAVVKDNKAQKTYLAWTMHHAVYDAWSLELLQEALEQVYHGAEASPATGLQPLVRYVLSVGKKEQRDFWKRQFRGLQAQQFPALPTATYQPRADGVAEYSVDRLAWPSASGITPSSVIRAAWAILLSRRCASPDAVFGAVVLGRQAPVLGISRLAGPTIATVPLRVAVDGGNTVAGLLQQVQNQSIDMIPHEQTGLQAIRRVGEEADRACQLLQSLLVVQPAPAAAVAQESSKPPIFQTPLDDERDSQNSTGIDVFSTHALTLTCHLEPTRLRLKLLFDSSVVPAAEAHSIVQSMEHTLHQLCQPALLDRKIRDLPLVPAIDLDRIWSWNAQLRPAAVHACVHDLIAIRVQEDPDAPAVAAWDGELTYGRLDELSTLLARALVARGVRPGDIVPLCFEKSVWVPVAKLAVMKAGAASVTMEASQPEERLRSIVQQAGPEDRVMVLSGESTEGVASKLVGQSERVFVLSSNTFADMDESSTSTVSLPVVQPSDLLYLVFTSGSTGVPKGVMITHQNFATATTYHTAALGFTPRSRVADFASYAFDVSWANFINTLTAGGCLCIPSEHDRKHDMTGFMARFGVNYADLTPAVAALLDPDAVPTLETVVVGGELVELDKLANLRERVKSLLITYGPAECTVTASAVDVCKHADVPARSIGWPCGAATWIVDPDNCDALLPVGAIGELVLEGPLNGLGYLNNAEKTAAAFVEDPKWLMAGTDKVLGRRGRVYKTGDLVKYHPDGSLIFIGRKDDQVKIRGQRVDLSEIEFHIRSLLPPESALQVVAEVIRPRESHGPVLVVFFSDVVQGTKVDDLDHQSDSIVNTTTPSESDTFQSLQSQLSPLLQDLDRALASRLPVFMLPSAYVPLANGIPISATGKTDRRAVRAYGASLDLPSLLAFSRSLRSGEEEEPHAAPETETEKELQRLWAGVLGLDPAQIGVRDSFMRLGGDSIAAMRLAAAARGSALLGGLTVVHLMKYYRLGELAGALDGERLNKRANGEGALPPLLPSSLSSAATEVTPFSLLLKPGLDINQLRQAAAEQCSVDALEVGDVYPCTALQEGLMALTAKKPGSYIQRTLLELQPHVDVDRLRRAWEEVVAAAPILRTRIVDLGVGMGGLAQVVLRNNRPLAWKQARTIESHRMLERKEEREQRSMCLGAPLVTFGLVEDGESSGPRYLACTQHHATYDGWSLKLLFEAVEEAYTKQQAVTRESIVPFQPFIQYLTAQGSSETTQSAFWTEQFSGLDASHFPVVPAQYQPQVDQALDHTIENLCWPTDDVTPSSVLRAAWATLLSWYTATPDAVFGAVVSGRQAAVPDMDKLAGPTIATVPVRIVVDEDMPVAELLRRTRLQAVDMIPFEQAGLQHIARCSDEARRACEFQTLLVVQAAETSDRDAAGSLAGHHHALFKRVVEDEESKLAELDSFGTYAITVTCDVDGPATRVRLGFDSKVITSLEVSRLACQLEHILRQFCQPETATSGLKVGQLSATPAQDLATIWQWNRTVPETVVSRVHDLFQQRVREDPAAPAVCAHDGELTFRELDDLSTRLARHLHHEAGVRTGVIVPLYFEKSVWVPVAILGVMKAGGACVTMDATLPVERLRNIVEQVAPVLLLNSAACEAAAPEVTDVPKLTIDHAFLSQLEVTERDLPIVDPSSPLYLVFTSGSTGKPKGAVVSHANYCSSARHHQVPLGIERTSRIYEFTSYAFDVAWSNMLHAFTSGACLCIPSEQDRITDIAGSVQRLRADLMHITPTVANILDPQSLPTLKKMLFTGEALKRGDVARWRSRPDVLYYNTYGPAECTVTSSVAVVDPFGEQEITIGQAHGVLAWIVRPDGKSLAAVGAPGELWVEGPTVGAGYLNNPDKTAAAFVEDPEWLLRGGAGVPGRRGRLYRTGDIVRYNPDGSLFYFGRKDTQVKIRGQRVELGEVDYNVRQLLPPSVQQVVAEIITPEATNAPLLAVFFTAEESHETNAMVDALKQQLVKRVPPYMVPTAYIPLAELPMTASGKTDRRALRELGKAYSALGVSELEDDASVLARGEDQQLTEEEQTLRTIWAGLLNVDARRIGPDHSFARLGGDSIKTMSLAVALRKQWNLQVPIPRLLAGSSSHGDTLRGMAALVRSLQHGQEQDHALLPAPTVDLESELAALTAQMKLPPQLEHRPTVFLTGATGYLGTQILRHIIIGGLFGHAVLLVRRSGTQDGLSRVRQAAEKAGWWRDSFASSISVWDGDLAAPRLGLTGKQWASLCGSTSYGLADDLPAIDAVIHNGAAVHWGAHYEHLKAANVGSTLQLLQAALHSKTLSKFVYVSGGLSARDWAGTTTTTSATGYDQSKYISERLVLAAAASDSAEDEKQDAAMVRNKKNRFSVVKPGLIIGDAHDGLANPDDFLWRVVAAASRLRARPVESLTARLDVQDVAFVADVVLQHATPDSDGDGDGAAAHHHRPEYVELNRGMPVEAFWAAVQDALEQPLLRQVTWDEWIEMARHDIAEEGEQHPLFPVQHFLGNLGVEEDERAGNNRSEVEREIREVSEAVRMNVRYLSKAGVLGGEEGGISWRQATANLTMRSRKW